MSNETQGETPEAAVPSQPKPKQYLLMANELHMAMLSKMVPGMLFVQVEGMSMQNNPNYMLLVNPIAQPEVTQPIEGVKPEESKVE